MYSNGIFIRCRNYFTSLTSRLRAEYENDDDVIDLFSFMGTNLNNFFCVKQVNKHFLLLF